MEGEPTGETPLKAPGVEGVQETPMIVRVNPDTPGVFIVKGPAHIVVTAEIVEPIDTAWEHLPMRERAMKKLHLSRRRCFPEERH